MRSTPMILTEYLSVHENAERTLWAQHRPVDRAIVLTPSWGPVSEPDQKNVYVPVDCPQSVSNHQRQNKKGTCHGDTNWQPHGHISLNGITQQSLES